MAEQTEQFLKQIPPQDELRRQIEANIAERNLLRTLLRIAEKRDTATAKRREGRPCK